MSGHKCPAPGCTSRVPHSQLCCRSHWFALPKPIRDEVWAAYRQEQLSERHLKAIDAATTYLKKLEEQKTAKPGEGQCSSCKRPILWAMTQKAKAIPLDPEPTDEGNIVLEKPEDPREPTLARMLRPAEPRPEGQPRYFSHFVTCPDASKFRRSP